MEIVIQMICQACIRNRLTEESLQLKSHLSVFIGYEY